MKDLVGKLVKVDKEFLIKRELKFNKEILLEWLCYSEEHNNKIDELDYYEKDSIFSYTFYFGSTLEKMSEEEMLIDAEAQATRICWHSNNMNENFITDFDEEYFCLAIDENKSDIFPKHIRDINYNEKTLWAKVMSKNCRILFREANQLKGID